MRIATLRSIVVGLGLAAGAPMAPSSADVQLGPLVAASGRSPFADCTRDRPRQQVGRPFGNAEVESWLAVDPTRWSVVIGFQQDRWSEGGGARGNAGAISGDAGRTWVSTIPPKVTKCTGGPFDRASDPWVEFAPDGTAFFMALAFDQDLPDGSGYGRSAMVVSRSTNGGRTWQEPVLLIDTRDPRTYNDKNSLTTDPHDAHRAYAVWLRWTDFVSPTPATSFRSETFFARTTDGGLTWEPARSIYTAPQESYTVGDQIVVLPDGGLLDIFTEVAADGSARIATLRGRDHGRFFERHATYIHQADYLGVYTPDRERYVRDGSTLLDVASDRGGRRIFLVWQDSRFRGVDEVAFSQSLDEGRSWSAPIRIDRTPEAANLLREQAFVPSIAVTGDGSLVVTHYDFRFDRDGPFEATDHWALICRAGRDCSRRSSWGEEQRLTDRSFDALLAPDSGGLFLGDYTGLAARGRRVWSSFAIPVGQDRTDIVVRRLNIDAR